MRALAFAAVVALVPIAAFSSDGVLEINQTCAVQTGCFPGDAPGFPVTITASGSYRLTSGLLPAVAVPSSAIEISASDVAVDFNHFLIQGIVPAAPFIAGVSGTGDRIRVLNGSVVDFYAAISISGSFIEISNLQIRAQDAGILVGAGCRVIDNTIAVTNGGRGLRTGNACIVSRNVISSTQNGSAAIIGDRSTITENYVNGADGGISTTNSIVQGNTVSVTFAGHAIFLSNGGFITGNVVSTTSGNGIVASDAVVSNNRASGYAGIVCSDCSVIGNVTTGVIGLDASGGNGTTGYQGNQFNGTAALQVIGGIETGPNVCGGDLICP